MSSDQLPSSSSAPAPQPADFDPVRQLDVIKKAMAKRSFCIFATSSAKNRPHAVGLNYAADGLNIYLVVSDDTIKVRNVRENPSVAICIPVRKFPFGPPMAVQFQGEAQILRPDDPGIKELLAAGRLRRITAFGAIDHPGVCFLKISPRRRISSYGLGVSPIQLLRDLRLGARSVALP